MGAEAQQAIVDANGPTYVRDFGGSGTPIILVHSMGSSSADWLSLAPQLTGQHRVVALDLPGFGRSPLARRSGYVEDSAKVLHSVIKQMALAPAIVVGNSMGGMVSSITASQHPEDVRALVLINSALPLMNRHAIRRGDALYFGAYCLPMGSRLIKRYVEKHGAKQVLLGSLPVITAYPNRIDRAVVEGMLESFYEQLKFPDPMLAYCRGARSVVSHLVRRKKELAMFRRITCPVLLVHGAKDPLIWLEQAQRVAKAFPTWDLTVLPDAGHVPHLEQPTEVAEAILLFTATLGSQGVA